MRSLLNSNAQEVVEMQVSQKAAGEKKVGLDLDGA